MPGQSDITTDARGKALLGNLPAPNVRITLSKLGWSTVEKMEVAVDGSRRVTLRPAGMIRGTVTEAAGGKPLYSYTIHYQEADGNKAAQQRAIFSANGQFELTELKVGVPYNLSIEATGFEKLTAPGIPAMLSDRAPTQAFALKAEPPKTN